MPALAVDAAKMENRPAPPALPEHQAEKGGATCDVVGKLLHVHLQERHAEKGRRGHRHLGGGFGSVFAEVDADASRFLTQGADPLGGSVRAHACLCSRLQQPTGGSQPGIEGGIAEQGANDLFIDAKAGGEAGQAILAGIADHLEQAVPDQR